MVELEDDGAETKVELFGKPDIEVDVGCPVTRVSKSCGQAIIILFGRQYSAEVELLKAQHE